MLVNGDGLEPHHDPQVGRNMSWRGDVVHIGFIQKTGVPSELNSLVVRRPTWQAWGNMDGQARNGFHALAIGIPSLYAHRREECVRV